MMQVELLAITQPLNHSSNEFFLEHCGRVCYRSQPNGKPGDFLRGRIIAGHESIIEHSSATFEISGISRTCSHQLVRSRIASHSQESQRYVNAMEARYTKPESMTVENNPGASIEFDAAVMVARSTYERLILLGVPKEDARFVLPQAIETRIVTTMNFRELRHFFNLRLDKPAQWEIKAVAAEMLRLVRPHAPSVFEDIKSPVN